ncbi:hypothetical protein [Aquimarina latercula]|uniref:hypothetical protein n=1 Tax=Aquimarina latercula TaxID=987 RepID=UPI000419D20E|nr:hypothetical protein [Aquimarina latercula]
MRKVLLYFYSITMIFLAIHFSGVLRHLQSYCIFHNQSSFLSFLLSLAAIPSLFYFIFKLSKIEKSSWILIMPILMFFLYAILYEKKQERFFQKNDIIIDQAIITKKTHSKLSWYVEAKFQIRQDTFRREFKINGNLLKTKNKGDTILIKYIKDCPKIMTEFDFSPSKEDLKFYRNGKLIQNQ